MRTNWRTITYWGLTGLFAAMMLLSGVLYLSGAAPVREGLAHLGYPGYVLIILGTAKLLGAPALLQNRLPALREWAYAGFTINLIGAAASHLFAGDAVSVAMVPAMLLVLLAASYVLQTGNAVARGRSVRGRVAIAA